MKLDHYLEEFDGADPEEALEMLMDFSSQLPPLSPARAALGQPASCRILECQTPVFLWVDIADGRVHVEASVHEKSPTVRGFVAMLVNGINGETVADVARLPDDFLPKLQLQKTLGMTRERGFRGIVARLKQEITTASAHPAAADVK